MPTPDLTRDYETGLLLLERDVVNTIGESHRALIAENVENARQYRGRPPLIEWVVEHVQQDLMDAHVDTTWPACPRQPNHPLWYYDGAWRCEPDHVSIPLGQLATRRNSVERP